MTCSLPRSTKMDQNPKCNFDETEACQTTVPLCDIIHELQKKTTSEFIFGYKITLTRQKVAFGHLFARSGSLSFVQYSIDIFHLTRGRRYYRNRSGIAIPKGLVSVSESNFAHPWVSVSVSVSNFSIFGYPTQ